MASRCTCIEPEGRRWTKLKENVVIVFSVVKREKLKKKLDEKKCAL